MVGACAENLALGGVWQGGGVQRALKCEAAQAKVAPRQGGSARAGWWGCREVGRGARVVPWGARGGRAAPESGQQGVPASRRVSSQNSSPDPC